MKIQGAALLTALFITALVAIVSINLIDTTKIATARTALYIHGIQAENAATFVGEYARASQQDLAPTTLLAYPNLSVSGVYKDLQGLLNLRNCQQAQWRATCKRVFDIMGAKASQTLMNAIKKDQLRLNDESELRLLLDASAYRKLRPFVTLLPNPTPININAASEPILRALMPALSPQTARAIVLMRQQTPFTSIRVLREYFQIAPPANLCVTNSRYGMMTAKVQSSKLTLKRQFCLRKQKKHFEIYRYF